MSHLPYTTENTIKPCVVQYDGLILRSLGKVKKTCHVKQGEAHRGILSSTQMDHYT